MKPLIRMTGPHPSRIQCGGVPVPAWHVTIVDAKDAPQGAIYKCLSYRRAVSLSCNMARDRRPFLHMDALPHWNSMEA